MHFSVTTTLLCTSCSMMLIVHHLSNVLGIFHLKTSNRYRYKQHGVKDEGFQHCDIVHAFMNVLFIKQNTKHITGLFINNQLS